MKRTTKRNIGIVLAVLGAVLAVWGILTLTAADPAASASMGIIGGADGPTAIFVTSKAGPLAVLFLLFGTGVLPLVLGAVCLVIGLWLLLRKK